jgi:hypothetical protein
MKGLFIIPGLKSVPFPVKNLTVFSCAHGREIPERLAQ